MRKIILIFVFCFSFLITHYSFAQSGWVNYSLGTNNRILRDIYFVNSNTGWSVGDTTAVFKSTNGGINWIKQDINYSTPILLRTVKFIDENTGFVAGGHDTPMNGYYYSYMFKTTNGGNNWIIVNDVSGNCFFNSIFLVDVNTIFTTKEGIEGLFVTVGGVYKSTNGGVNFNLCVTRGQSNSVYFANQNTGWASAFYTTDAGNSKGYILKTTNSGLNWNEQHKDSLSNNTEINKIQFINVNTGFAIGKGSYAKFFKTTNSGVNWSITNFTHSKYQSLFFIDQNTGWIAGASYPDTSCIAYTSNGGVNWILQKKNYSAFVNNIFFINSLTGWAAISNGGIMKTVTGGFTSVKKTENTLPDKFSLSQNYPNPFNPSTIIKFQIKKLSSPYALGGDLVKLIVYDILGKEVVTLVNEKINPGEYEVTFDGSRLPSGIYFYTLNTDNFKETKKMLLIK